MTLRCAVAVCVLGLAGCGATPQRLADVPPLLSVSETSALQNWDLWTATGRLAVKSAQDGFNAHFEWRQTGVDSELLVEGPFGAGRSVVRISPDHIRVEAGTSPPTDFLAPFTGVEATLTERLGFAVPLRALSYWLRGVPDPNLGVDSGAPGAFVQTQWQVLVDERAAAAVDVVGLPRKLTLTQGNARIRVIVDHWTGRRP